MPIDDSAQNHQPILVGTKDAARAIGVSVSSLYRLVGANKLRAYKRGSATLYRVADLRAYAESLPLADIRTAA